MRRRQLGRLALAAGALIVVAACRGGGSGGKAQPVEEQLGLGPDGILQRQATAENFIRDCMKGQGFDYVPVDPNAQRTALVGQSGLSEEDYLKQFGYGITTLYEQRQRVALGPNEAIRNALRATDKVAYDRALHGDDPTATFAEALDTGDYSRLGGCVRTATEQVFGGLATFQTIQDKLNELDARIIADTRVVAAVAKWSECMRAAGYDLAQQDQLDSVLQRELEAIVGPPDNRKPDYDHAALTALQRKEISMVTADLSCEKKHIAAVEEKVRAEYERTFREQNADLLTKVPPP
jgi:hypothetical protein